MEEETNNRLMCYLGMHVYQMMETKEITNDKGEVTGYAYVSKCRDCGKIKTTYVPISEKWVQNLRMLRY